MSGSYCHEMWQIKYNLTAGIQRKIIFHEDKLDITMYYFCTVNFSELKCYLSEKSKNNASRIIMKDNPVIS